MIFDSKIIYNKYLKMSNRKPKVTIPKSSKAFPMPINQVEQALSIQPKTSDPLPVIFTIEMIKDAATLDKDDFAGLLDYLADAYYNAEQLIADNEYEKLITLYEQKYGPYNAIGAVPRGTK